MADVTLGDIGRALARYRPVLITVAIILAVIAVLPGPRRAALSALPSVPPPAAAAAAAVPAADAVVTDTTVPVDDTASSSSSTFDSSSSSSSGFSSAPSPSSSSSSSDFTSDDSSSSSSSSDFSAPSPTADFSSSDFATTTTVASRPLTVVEAGWASATGATPVGSTGVPDKGLPVGKRIGQVDKYSFVRLTGEQKVLSLRVNPQGARVTTGAIGVSICQITDAGWQPADNVPSDRAPKYDTATCVKGDPGDGKTWTFNVLTFASPTDARGLALVPTGDSIDYQVTFERT